MFSSFNFLECDIESKRKSPCGWIFIALSMPGHNPTPLLILIPLCEEVPGGTKLTSGSIPLYRVIIKVFKEDK